MTLSSIFIVNDFDLHLSIIIQILVFITIKKITLLTRKKNTNACGLEPLANKRGREGLRQCCAGFWGKDSRNINILLRFQLYLKYNCNEAQIIDTFCDSKNTIPLTFHKLFLNWYFGYSNLPLLTLSGHFLIPLWLWSIKILGTMNKNIAKTPQGASKTWLLWDI